jgi:hypothetical protein
MRVAVARSTTGRRVWSTPPGPADDQLRAEDVAAVRPASIRLLNSDRAAITMIPRAQS